MFQGGSRWLVALAVVVGLAGCGGSGGGGGLPVGGRQSGAATSGGAGKPLPTKPLEFTFDIPEGFIETDRYSLLVPLHRVRKLQWIRPADADTGDVIFVASYVMDSDSTGEPDDKLRDRIRAYAGKIEAVKASDPVKASVDGRKAWRQYIEQPDPGTAGNLRYDAIFVFIGPYLVQVGCQVVDKPEVVAPACNALLDSLEISDP